MGLTPEKSGKTFESMTHAPIDLSTTISTSTLGGSMATRKAPLRAVKADEKAAVKVKPSTVAEAAEGGDHRELLVAMRERIAKTVSDPSCPPRDLAALTRRLQDIAKEIDAIDLRLKEEAKEDGVSADEDWDEAAL
jgi:hypothetical protein